MNVLNINIDIFIYILSFLDNCNNFLHSFSVRQYNELFNLKYKYFKLNLNNEYSLKYYRNINFRNFFNKKYQIIFINLSNSVNITNLLNMYV